MAESVTRTVIIFKQLTLEQRETLHMKAIGKQKDKTCVPVVPQATEEQRETLHQKAIGKHKETKTQYEVLLRYGDIEGEFTVDVREDIVTLDDDPVTEEYIEGFIYNTYDEAKKKYVEFIAQYDTLDTEIFTWNEVEDE